MQHKYFDRDLSWLSFNYRVLQEAKDTKVPLYERIKFLAIYSSNLDEFFRVRVASLQSILKLGKTKFSLDTTLSAEELLNQILETVHQQQMEFGEIYRNSILPALKKQNIVLYQDEDVHEKHEPEIRHYFRTKVLAYLQPVIISERAPFPFLKNRALYFIAALKRKEKNAPTQYAVLNIPSDQLPRFFSLSPQNGHHYFIFLDDVIRANMPLVFPGYTILSCHSIKINRDADLHIEDEFTGDLVEKISEQIKKRNIGVPSRFLYDYTMPENMQEFIKAHLQLPDDEVVTGGRYHNFYDFMGFPNPLKPALENKKFPALPHTELDQYATLFEAIAQQDYMLHFPYNSYDYVLRYFNEAAIDPYVTEIKLTMYRIAANSLIANALISAVKNGKKVTVFVEVKARFDEANNLKWAEAMKEEGIKIIYSIPGLKVHAKVALVIRKKGNKRQEFAFLGTGNFNEGTAKIYADHGLLTTHQEITNELNQVFKYLNKRKQAPELQHLLVSQFNIVPQFIEWIDDEIQQAKEGKQAEILIKVNNLEDPVMIDKLYEAGQAGVKINLIVRGICCLMPHIKGLDGNIQVTRLVDRYLEHARVFIFHHRGAKKIYMGSADWMKRNLYHRIEVVFPVYDPEIQKEILQMMELQLRDNIKGVLLDAEQKNIPKTIRDGDIVVRAQEDTFALVKKKNERE